MRYKYQSDNTIDRLLESYQSDKDPFITNTNIKFQQRNNFWEEVNLLRELFFPNYFRSGRISQPNNRDALEAKVNRLHNVVYYSIKPYMKLLDGNIKDYEIRDITNTSISKLPDIRETLKSDVEAAFVGDPAPGRAARKFTNERVAYTEIIRTYPGFLAILVQRFGHGLYILGIPIYPGELSKYIQGITGAELHPGANIGEKLFIDHAVGVTVGETADILDNVRLYQNVTLGALSLSIRKVEIYRESSGKRHPKIGNNAIIYPGASVLGGDTEIGDNCIIGANASVFHSIPPNHTVPANAEIRKAEDLHLLRPIINSYNK